MLPLLIITCKTSLNHREKKTVNAEKPKHSLKHGANASLKLELVQENAKLVQQNTQYDIENAQIYTGRAKSI